MNSNLFSAIKPSQWPTIVKDFLIVVGSFAFYYLSARLGLEMATINKQASPVWPATGVAMGLILLLGPRAGIGIFLAAFFSNFETGLNLPACTAIAGGNTMESLFFVWMFTRAEDSEKRYGVHTRVIFGLFILLLSAGISASIGTAALWVTSVIPSPLIVKNWFTWWIGDLLGALFLTPMAYKLRYSGFSSLKIEVINIPKLMLIFVCLAANCYFIFATEVGRPFLFLIFLPILLAANWFDSVWIYIAALVAGAFSVWQTISGNGPFNGSLLNDSLIHLQIFLAGLSITSIGLGSMKQEGIHYRPNIALLCGWLFAGMTFYYSYTSTTSRDENRFGVKVNQSKEAIENRMNDYFRLLESGVSFFNASDHVSQEEWRLFTDRLLSTNKYIGIEGVGVIFSSTIKDRFSKNDLNVMKYQPNSKFHSVSSVLGGTTFDHPDDNFIITYIEPREKNKPAVGLDVASEQNRYEAAVIARDSGLPGMTDEIQLVQDDVTRPGFLIYAPIYKRIEGNSQLNTIENRRRSFIGFVYAPIIFENFMQSSFSHVEDEINFKTFVNSKGGPPKVVYTSPNWETSFGTEVHGQIYLGGKTINAIWKRGRKFESTASVASSWIGFFGTIAALFLAVLLSSLQNLTNRAEKLAGAMTKEVNERKQMWQALTETSPVGIYLTDKNGQCIYVNPTWTRMTGLSIEQAKGQGWTKALHAEDVSKVFESWKNLVDGGTFKCSYRFVKDDQSIIHTTGQAIPIKNENQEVTGYFGTVQDITELHLNQMALLTASRMSSLGEMASGIAHEINNPLAIIQGKALYIEKVMENDIIHDKEKVSRSVKQIYTTVQRIAKIIKGLQTYARETSGLDFQRSQLRECLEETFELCRERFSHYNIELIVPTKISESLCFFGRSEQVSQVVLNLLNNAFDAVSDAQVKWVRVDINVEIDSFQISVSDSGAGISPDMQPKIFDPFFTTKDVGKGTGLGLSISKGIIEKHNGRLYLDTAKAQTTFVIDLPMANKAENAGVA